MKSPAAIRRAADTIESLAISDDTDALLTLWARFIERKAMGTACDDEAEALLRLLR